jgi:hypothetical protein
VHINAEATVMNTQRNLPITRPQVSSLTTDPVLKSIFRRLEDDGAVEVVPTFSPRPMPPAAVRVLDMVGA